MVEYPEIDRLDITAGLSVVTLLLVVYGLTSDAILRYTAWLVIFTIWMTWFVYFGTKWLYGIET
jgi:hypothetical protein